MLNIERCCPPPVQHLKADLGSPQLPLPLSSVLSTLASRPVFTLKLNKLRTPVDPFITYRATSLPLCDPALFAYSWPGQHWYISTLFRSARLQLDSFLLLSHETCLGRRDTFLVCAHSIVIIFILRAIMAAMSSVVPDCS